MVALIQRLLIRFLTARFSPDSQQIGDRPSFNPSAEIRGQKKHHLPVVKIWEDRWEIEEPQSRQPLL